MNETNHQATVVEYAETLGIMVCATAQSTFTKSWKQKMTNHKLGVRPGMLDVFFGIPAHLSIDNEARVVVIEMKKERGVRGGNNGSKVGDEQAQWLLMFREAGIPAYIARGSDEAIAILNKYVKRQGEVF